MDLFAAYPQLKACTAPVLAERKLRLISVAGVIWDAQACYFALSEERYWVRTAEGRVQIGVGGLQVPGTPSGEPFRALLAHIRKVWRMQVDYLPSGTLYVLEGTQFHVLPGATLLEPTTPAWLQLTPPRLGGGDMPDALVQAVYWLRLRSAWQAPRDAMALRVTLEGLEAFWSVPLWSVRALREQPWATLYLARPLPAEAQLRPVLALQGLRELVQRGAPLLVQKGIPGETGQ